MNNFYKCRVCGSDNIEIFFIKEDTFFWYGFENDYLKEKLNPKKMKASIYSCQNCGFIGLEVNEILINMVNIFYNSPFSKPGTTHGQNSNYSKKMTEDFFCYYRELAGKWIPKSVLEIGCQSGYLLYIFREMGSSYVTGIEPGNIDPYVGRDGYIVEVHRGFLSHDIIDKKNFELIVCLYVLEHIDDIKNFLSIIYELLAPKGRVLISVPNEYYSLSDGNIGMLILQHFNYFTPDSLTTTLNNNGFNILKIISNRKKGLYVLAEKGDQFNGNYSLNKQKRNEIKLLTDSYSKRVDLKLNKINSITEIQNGSIGLYGINCSMPNIFSWIPDLRNRKIFIYDSDSLKWNKYFSGVPFSVNPPEKLDLVDKVLVVPYRLQEEIYTFLLKKAHSNTEIIKLYD